MVQTKKKVALLHRFPSHRIRETNAAFPYMVMRQIDVLTFKTFDRTKNWKKFLKSLWWIFYAPTLVWRKGYDVIYCDDSFPFYPALVKWASPKSRVVLRLGDLHLMYYTSGWVYKILHYFERKVWKMADDIICISKAMQEYLFDEEVGSWVVNDPVRLTNYPRETHMHQGTVMFHGLLTKNKNVDILIEAACQMPDVTFVILGDGPDYKRLKALAPGNVRFFGWVDFNEVNRHIKNCAVGVALRGGNPGNEFVVTSPFLQYGAMGKPCLVTRRKVFGSYRWQFTCMEELETQLRYLIEHSIEEGFKLNRFIRDNHSAEKMEGEIWDILMQQS